MKLNKLTSTLLVAATLAVAAAPLSSAYAAPDAKKIAERKAQKGRAVGEKVGKPIGKAFELYNEGKVAEAIQLLESVNATEDFDKAFLWKFLGQLYVDKNPEKALSMLEKAARLDVLSFTDQSSLLRTVGDLSLMTKNYQQAINYYAKWHDFTGEENPDVYMRIASAYYEMKQYAKVIAPADQAIKSSPKPKKEHYLMKYASYYELKQIKKAITVLEDMLVLFPEEKQSWVNLGQFYSLDEQYDKSLAILDLAYKQGLLKTENEIKVLANMYNNNNVPYKAAALLDKHMAAGLVKKERSNLMATASAYGVAREFEKSAKFYGMVADMDKDGEAYRRQGNSLLMANKNAEAVVALTKALEKGVKERGKVHVDLIQAYFYQGKMREAYQQVALARQNGQEKMANSWGPYVKERAEKKGIKL